MLDVATYPQQTRPPTRATELEDIVLRDYLGSPVRLGDLWEERPAALVFLRHYGCVFCRDHAVQLHRDRNKFEAADINLAVIGQGTPEQAAEFRRIQGVEIPLLVDPDRRSYEAAGAKVAVLSELLGPRVIARGIQRTVVSRIHQGNIVVHQGRITNHAAQLGGVLVVARDSSIRYAHLSEDAADNPPNAEVLAVARAIRPHAEPDS